MNVRHSSGAQHSSGSVDGKQRQEPLFPTTPDHFYSVTKRDARSPTIFSPSLQIFIANTLSAAIRHPRAYIIQPCLIALLPTDKSPGLKSPLPRTLDFTTTTHASMSYNQAPQAPRSPPKIQPCRYKTGKTLGAGSYSVVKECVHIDTGRYYAAKVINKRLMAGREHMVSLKGILSIPYAPYVWRRIEADLHALGSQRNRRPEARVHGPSQYSHLGRLL